MESRARAWALGAGLLFVIAFLSIANFLDDQQQRIEIETLTAERDRLRQYARQFGHLAYLASDYGEDLRANPSKRLSPLDQFALPIEKRPLLIQADDVIIQVYTDEDSLRVDAFRVWADTTEPGFFDPAPGEN